MALPFSGHGVTLGGLELVAWGDGVTHDGGFVTEISADGTTWGNPQVAVSSLISALSDGDIVQQQRAGNREPVLYVRIIGDSHAGLVNGDTALSAVVGGPCELVWQPPDVDAPPTVIDVVHSRMDHAWDDMDALKFERVWIVTMSALPWPRSADLVVTPAVATAGASVVNDGSSTANWSAPSPSGAALSLASGAVLNTYPAGSTEARLRLAVAMDVTTTKYLAVDWKSSLPAYHGFWINDTGTHLTEIRREPVAGGYVRSWFKVDDALTTVASMTLTIVHPASAGSSTLSVDQVQKSATLPVSGSARQVARTVDPSGNVSAEGTVIIQHGATGLGQTIVFTHPVQGGYNPPLRQWRAAGATPTVDANAVSGYRSTLDTVTSFVIPANSVPRGDVHLWARVLRPTAGAGTLVGAAYSASAPSVFVGDSQPFQVNRTFPADQWVLMPVARLTLPTAEIGSGGYVQIDISGAGLQVDEAWLFAMDKGCLTVVDTTRNRLRIDAPTPAKPFGALMVANLIDWSDAHTPAASSVLCDQTGHRFDPDGSMVHVVTSGPATEAAVSFEHFPRWRAEAA